MAVFGGGNLFHSPAKVSHEEGRRPRYSPQLVVIKEHDSARAQQPPAVVEIDEDGVKAMVAVYDGKIEGLAFA